MTSLAVALQVRRLVQDDAALRMLRMDSLPLVAGVLETHLSAPNATMPTHQLYNRKSPWSPSFVDFISLRKR